MSTPRNVLLFSLCCTLHGQSQISLGGGGGGGEGDGTVTTDGLF